MRVFLIALIALGVSSLTASAEDCDTIVVSTDIDPDKRPRQYGKVTFSFRDGNTQSHYVDTDGDHQFDIMLVDEGVDWKMDRIVYFFACPANQSKDD